MSVAIGPPELASVISAPVCDTGHRVGFSNQSIDWQAGPCFHCADARCRRWNAGGDRWGKRTRVGVRQALPQCGGRKVEMSLRVLVCRAAAVALKPGRRVLAVERIDCGGPRLGLAWQQ